VGDTRADFLPSVLSCRLFSQKATDCNVPVVSVWPCNQMVTPCEQRGISVRSGDRATHPQRLRCCVHRPVREPCSIPSPCLPEDSGGAPVVSRWVGWQSELVWWAGGPLDNYSRV